jgi:soluble lytic murein transglycosylase-like protein
MRSFQQEPAADTSRPDRMLSPVFRPEVLFWADAIVAWAAAAGVDPDLAAVVMQIESCGDPGATSRSGAMGLFQVMPFHFASSELPYDPETNALRGLGYLARSLEASGGDARLALAGYNGGIGVINWDEQAWSQQTQRYVRYGASIYADIQSGRERSLALEEWYAGFGVNLCRAAADRLGIQP